MKIYTDTPEGATVVHNTFIDQYMPHANGEYVKVYLYLLRCADTGRDLSLSSIADVFDYTEKDIQRALAYWEKQQLLRVKLGSDGSVLSVTFLDMRTAADPLSAGYASVSGSISSGYTSAAGHIAAGSSGTAPAGNASDAASSYNNAAEHTINPQDMPDRDRIAAVREQKEIRQLFYVAEQYLQRPLTSSEQSDFIYYYDNLQFSTDLIEYLLEYCISKGSASRHYMRRVALSWAEAGISTVLQAKQETNLHNRNYFTIMNAFGIKGRGPAAPEQEAMARWFNEFGFTIDIILEACRRTIRQTHQPNFQYADKILEQWHSSGVTSLSDIEKLDQQRRNEQKKPAAKPQKTAGNRFNNFSQREYDYNQLEKQLLKQ
ncbi:MAG: DnaD domain protein [Lachnospiraceae bacterium]|nr:DnaD domain protein [Lachnospiraceae bacterium]